MTDLLTLIDRASRAAIQASVYGAEYPAERESKLAECRAALLAAVEAIERREAE